MLTETVWEVREKLLFPRGVLEILRETSLFGESVERAIADIDFVIERIDHGQVSSRTQ